MHEFSAFTLVLQKAPYYIAVVLISIFTSYHLFNLTVAGGCVLFLHVYILVLPTLRRIMIHNATTILSDCRPRTSMH